MEERSFAPLRMTGWSKPELYRELADQARALLQGESDPVANAANLASLIWLTLPDLNWCGFYFLKPVPSVMPAKAGIQKMDSRLRGNDERELVLGPFQGKPACVRIALGKGVCGTAAAKRETVIVENVHEFEGHIACDSASNSEIVVPLVRNDEVLGVLDLDSPKLARFDQTDRAGLEALARIWIDGSDLSF